MLLRLNSIWLQNYQKSSHLNSIKSGVVYRLLLQDLLEPNQKWLTMNKWFPCVRFSSMDTGIIFRTFCFSPRFFPVCTCLQSNISNHKLAKKVLYFLRKESREKSRNIKALWESNFRNFRNFLVESIMSGVSNKMSL